MAECWKDWVLDPTKNGPSRNSGDLRLSEMKRLPLKNMAVIMRCLPATRTTSYRSLILQIVDFVTRGDPVV